MKTCRKCKEEVQEGATKCKHCGADLRNWFTRHKIMTGILTLFVLAIIGSAMGSQERKSQTAQQTDTVSALGDDPQKNGEQKQQISNTTSEPITSEKPEAPAAIPTTSFRDGTHVVGTDIQPGTYRTRTGSAGCYYERMSGFSGSSSDIIANNNTDVPAIVTILSTDKGFKAARCGTWTQDLSTITASKTSFSDGMFIVGTDILAGTYRSAGGDGCYYERLTGFSNTSADIIANENTETSAVVTIASSDKGFRSSRCGTWTRIE